MRVNMHIHTNYSDGKNSLEEVLEMVKNEKLEYFSITDHDSIESAKKLMNNNVKGYVNGIEITAYLDKSYEEFKPYFTVHILAYDYNVEEMGYHLLNWEQARKKVMLEFVVDYNKKYQTNLTVTGERKIVEQELIELGICKDKREAYNLLCEFTNYKISIPSINEVIDAIHQTNGLAIWAHPFEAINYKKKHKFTKKQIEKILETMIKSNIDGIESDYYIYNNEEKDYLKNLTTKHKLLYSIGSDFHGRDSDLLSYNSIVRENFFVNKLTEKRKDQQFIKLTNGRSGMKVYRDNDYVYKPTNNIQNLMTKLLNEFDKENFKYHQSLIETKDNYNKFTYIKGYNPNDIGRTTNEQFYEVMNILRDFHGISQNIASVDNVICHGDLSPNNSVFDGDKIVGIIDYDSLYEGSKFEDIAYLIFTWLDIGDSYRDFRKLIPVIKKGIEIYGLKESECKDFSKKLLNRAEMIKSSLDKNNSWYERTYEWANCIIERVLINEVYIKEMIG